MKKKVYLLVEYVLLIEKLIYVISDLWRIEYSIHLDRWYIKQSRSNWLMFIDSYIFIYRGDVLIASSSIVNNYLESYYIRKFKLNTTFYYYFKLILVF